MASELTDNKNFLSPVGFRFMLHRAPNIEYFCVEANIPSLTMDGTIQTTPLSNIPRPSDKIDYEPLDITFLIDEDLQNFLEIYNWLYGLGRPQSLKQYKDLQSGDGVYSDATLIILTSNNNGNRNIFFKNLFPINLSTLQFNTRETDIPYLEARVSFSFTNYIIE